jgi:Tfp pilus assembly protein PilE
MIYVLMLSSLLVLVGVCGVLAWYVDVLAEQRYREYVEEDERKKAHMRTDKYIRRANRHYCSTWSRYR